MSTELIGGIVTVATLLFGWLKFRDEQRFKGIEIKLAEAIVKIGEQGNKIIAQEAMIQKLSEENVILRNENVQFRVENTELRTRVEIFQKSVERQNVELQNVKTAAS